MIHDDLIRQVMLAGIAINFIGFALWTIFSSHSFARLLGYELSAPNGQSEFHAIYIGLFVAQAVLCIFAAVRVTDPALGDIVAFFLLAQPIGRLFALPRHGMPTGVMRGIFALELVAGIALLLVRSAGYNYVREGRAKSGAPQILLSAREGIKLPLTGKIDFELFFETVSK